MPLPPDFSIQTVGKFQIVALEGITQVIASLPASNISQNELKKQGFGILKKLNLVESAVASGVMFISRKNNLISIDPVVWVRDIQTLFYETACASGTTAVAAVEFLKHREGSDPSQISKEFAIVQPSGEKLIARIKRLDNTLSIAIVGKVKILKKNISLTI